MRRHFIPCLKAFNNVLPPHPPPKKNKNPQPLYFFSSFIWSFPWHFFRCAIRSLGFQVQEAIKAVAADLLEILCWSCQTRGATCLCKVPYLMWQEVWLEVERMREISFIIRTPSIFCDFLVRCVVTMLGLYFRISFGRGFCVGFWTRFLQEKALREVEAAKSALEVWFGGIWWDPGRSTDAKNPGWYPTLIVGSHWWPWFDTCKWGSVDSFFQWWALDIFVWYFLWLSWFLMIHGNRMQTFEKIFPLCPCILAHSHHILSFLEPSKIF